MKRLIFPSFVALVAGIVFQLPVSGTAIAVDGPAGPPVIGKDGQRMSPGGKRGERFPILRELESTTSKFYCGDRIVAPGDTKTGVIEKCGEPARKERRREERIEAVTSDGMFLTSLTTEEWVYNFGPDRFLYYLKFRDEILVEIKTGEYGY